MDYSLAVSSGDFVLGSSDIQFERINTVLPEFLFSSDRDQPVVKKVYFSRRNTVDLKFQVNCLDMDLSGTTQVVVTFEGSAIVADTDVDASFVTWDIASTLTFNLAGLAFVHGDFKAATIIVYSPSSPQGQSFAHIEDRGVQFLFLDE